MSKLKIIQIVQKPQLRGAEIFACQLSNHLVDKGHEVMVVTIYPGDADLPFKGEIIDLNRPYKKRFFDPQGWRTFSNIVEKFKPDIIQANASDTLKFAVGSRFLNKWRFPIVFRNANKISDFIDSKPKKLLNSIYTSQVDYVVSVSKECEKDFIKTFNFDKRKISTVEIGVEDIDPEGIPEDLQAIYDIGKVVVHIGGFVPEKNHSGLLNILKEIIREDPKTQVLLIGQGKLRNKVEEKIEELNLWPNVHLLGYRSDVLNILKNSQAFVLPSFIEGLPGVILEAMACRTPVVAYNVGGIGEVVKSGETGWLVSKNDEDQFVNDLKTILDAGEIVESRIKNARAMIESQFFNSKIAERFINVYSSLLRDKESI
jgi:glycosyltransferase involved in cell wall biosynthesis